VTVVFRRIRFGFGLIGVAVACLALPVGNARASWPGTNGHLALDSDIPSLCCDTGYTVGVDGSALFEIYSDPSQDLAIDEYSPDGSTLLVSRSNAGSCPGGASLWALRDDGLHQDDADLVLLDDPAGPDDSPPFGCPEDTIAAYSMDGSRVAFGRSGSADADRNGVWVMNADGTNKVRIATASDPSDVRWSFDMTEISYVNGGTIYKVNSDGSTVTPVASSTEFPQSPGAVSEYSGFPPPADSPTTLSPDGTLETFLHCCYADTGSVPQVNVANADGTNVHRITNFEACPGEFCGTTGGDIGQVTWQPIPIHDASPPAISSIVTGTAGTNGWYTSLVEVKWTTGDPDSGIFYTEGCDPTSLGSETAGTTFSCFALNRARVPSRGTVTVRIDETPPTVAFAGNTGSYTVDQQVAITCSAGDALSGLASSTCQNVVEPAYQLGLGSHTLTAVAVDKAGNGAQASTTLTVSVTPASLCSLAEQFVQSSARYQALSPASRAAADRLANAVCQAAQLVVPHLNPAAKKLVLAAFDIAVQALERQTWLTSSQVGVLETLAQSL
jgi:hypothetical protein